MMIPNPVTSIRRVIKINPIAAFLEDGISSVEEGAKVNDDFEKKSPSM